MPCRFILGLANTEAELPVPATCRNIFEGFFAGDPFAATSLLNQRYTWRQNVLLTASASFSGAESYGVLRYLSSGTVFVERG